MTAKDLVKTLKEQANSDFETAEDLFKHKRYTYALFFGHLSLEKLLKSLVVYRTNDVYPPIHNLNKLAVLAGIPLTEHQKKDLDEITSFNIEARYDDEKMTFHRKATEKFTRQWMAKIKEYKIWLENLF